MYNIGFGKKFVRELLLLGQLRYGIETKTSDGISEHEKKNNNKIQAIKRFGTPPKLAHFVPKPQICSDIRHNRRLGIFRKL